MLNYFVTGLFERGVMTIAMDEIKEKTCVEFTPVTSDDVNFVIIFRGRG